MRNGQLKRTGARLARDGIHWHVGEPVQVYDQGKGQIDLFHTPDEIDVEVEDFNRKVTPGTSTAWCAEPWPSTSTPAARLLVQPARPLASCRSPWSLWN